MEMQTVSFYSHPYAGGTNSCFLKASLRWRSKHWLYKSTLYAGGTNSSYLKLLEVQTVQTTNYTGGTNRCFLNQIPTLEVQTVAF